MGREKEPKGDGKAKHKATKLKKLTEDCESAGAGGDADTHKLVNNECGRKSKKKKRTTRVDHCFMRSQSDLSDRHNICM